MAVWLWTDHYTSLSMGFATCVWGGRVLTLRVAVRPWPLQWPLVPPPRKGMGAVAGPGLELGQALHTTEGQLTDPSGCLEVVQRLGL